MPTLTQAPKDSARTIFTPTSLAGREALVFLGLAAFFYGFWALVYEPYLSWTVDPWFAHVVAEQAAWCIRLLGHAAQVEIIAPYPELIVINGLPGVNVGTPCNGLAMLYLFFAFIVAHPGPLKAKAWFIPLGLLLIHASNLVRVMALGFCALYYREFFEVNHKYVYAGIVYSLVIGLFLIWHLRLAKAPAAEA